MDDPCFGVSYQGKCEGNVVTWCESNELIQVDCSDHNSICEWQDEEEYWGCTPMADANVCDHGDQGECIDETTVVWCSGLEQTTLSATKALYADGTGSSIDCVPEDEATNEATPPSSYTDPTAPEDPEGVDEGLDMQSRWFES